MVNKLVENTSILLVLSFGLNALAAPTIVDPTRPSFGTQTSIIQNPEEPKKEQKLTAIFFKSGVGTAIINNNLYQSGEFFSGNKIVKIESNSVLLKNQEGYFRLTLINQFKKQKK